VRLTGRSDRDFIRMGRGIQQRYARCAEYWNPHLTFSRTFIQEHVEPVKRIAVLGAGRLFDIALPQLVEQAEEVHLFDADPTCVKSWRAAAPREFNRRVIPRIEDITGCLAQWTAELKSVNRSSQLCAYINSLEAPAPRWAEEPFDGVVSLNVAGQIPLYWRDRVLAVKGELSDDESDALTRSYERLQVAHLLGVTKAAAQWGVVITDVEYYFYQSHISEWQVERALYGAAGEIFAGLCDQHDASCADRWLWHLAPQFVESDAEGEIHRVEARRWRSSPTRR
jgi:hypothetical protein